MVVYRVQLICPSHLPRLTIRDGDVLLEKVANIHGVLHMQGCIAFRWVLQPC